MRTFLNNQTKSRSADVKLNMTSNIVWSRFRPMKKAPASAAGFFAAPRAYPFAYRPLMLCFYGALKYAFAAVT